MSNNTEQFLNGVKNQKGLKGKVKRLLFRGILVGFEALLRDLKNNEELLENCRVRQESLEKTAERLSEENVRMAELAGRLQSRLDAAEQLLSVMTESLNGLEQKLAETAEIRGLTSVLSEKTDAVRNDLEKLSINVRNNNGRLDMLSSDSELSKTKLMGIQRELKTIASSGAVPTLADAAVPVSKNVSAGESSDYESIDYFDFENHFRGSIESIKNAQRSYLKYFADKKHVLDIGCGRGEFLSLLKECGVFAEGVDVYQPYADYCNMKGLKAECADGIEFLADSHDEIDGIFVGQVVEHLETGQIIRLCEKAWEKLPEGGCIVIETPNPTSLAIYTNAFYIDPSHVKPVHPLTMKYYLEKAGFKNIKIIYTESSRPPYSIPELKCTAAENADEFNAAMKTVSDIIFGSQDYAIAAVK